MPLPKSIRRLTPESVRESVTLRAIGVGTGLIPPRTMHSEAESALLARLAIGRRRAVEIGVYEGSSAVVLTRALPVAAELHLIDPFTANATLRPGQSGTERATRRVVGRAVRERGGPMVSWYVELSQETAESWQAPLDFVFIDGDHSEEGARRDWEDWHGFVEPGGVVIFHDAREGKPGGGGLPGPTAVVDSVLRSASRPAGWEVAEEIDTMVVAARLGAL